MKSSYTHLVGTMKNVTQEKTLVILPSICQNLTKKFQMKQLIAVTSRFVQLQIKVLAFIEPVVRDFVVGAAVFQAVLLFVFATFLNITMK